jgi:ATP-binding cassette subfamily B protein
MQFAMYGCMLMLSWAGAKMIVSGTMTTGQLMSLFSYTGQILMSLMMFSMILVMIAISRASAERIVQVLEEKTDLSNGPNPVTELTDGSIRFSNLDFSYAGEGGRLCLKNISLEIQSGQTIGIVGGTGTGKSTLNTAQLGSHGTPEKCTLFGHHKGKSPLGKQRSRRRRTCPGL